MARIISGGNELLQPKAILEEHLRLQSGQVVADLGCGGSGFFSIEAARIVGDQGQVYAVDIVKEALSSVDGKARLQGLYNVKTVWSDIEIYGATEIPERSLDHALLINVLFQSKHHMDIIKEATRLLKSGGKLLIVDWNDVPAPFGPAAADRVKVEFLRENIPPLGFTEEKYIEPGQHHFGLLFSKS